eukprot:164641_1
MASLNIQHSFTHSDDEKEMISNKEAVIAVGSTGTGKSSIIRIYCGDQVDVGHDVESKTKESSLFKELNNNNKYWLDSQGANDTTGTNDEKVLKDVLRKLYDESITKIKVIWCVSGDMCREKQEFQTQARFIKSLGHNTWNSCVFIKKKGRPQPNKMDGVLAAANRYGANISHGDNRLFGFKALEYGNIQDDELLEVINEGTNTTQRKEKYKKHGYFINSEIVTEVNNKLSVLPFITIHFTMQKCSKCAVKGDPRFIYAPCHSKLEKYHPHSTVPYHSGSLRSFHSGSLQSYHSGSPQSHNIYESYHPGKWDDHVVRNASLHLLTFGIHTIARAATDSFADWTCCHSTNYNKSGCRQRIKSSYVKYSCCSGAAGSHGCLKKYGCCNGAVGSSGCRKEFNCCGGAQSNSGCNRKYECCQNNLGSAGCKNRCQSCKRTWGNSSGCSKTTEH